jgi:hypothetical protein
MIDEIFGWFFFILFTVALIAGFFIKPKCPKCKIGKLHQHDVHKPDRWGIGTNIYKCNHCAEEWI